MKTPHTYIHTYIHTYALLSLALLTTQAQAAYPAISKKPGVVLIPSSIYYNGLLQSVTSPQRAGYLQQAFNATGYEILTLITDPGDNPLALQPDGKIVIAGSTNNNYSIARLNPNGSLDTSFNPTGTQPGTYILPRFTNSTADNCFALQLQADGKIILSGWSFVGGSVFYSIARLTTNGFLDATFNPTGALPGTYILPQFGASATDGTFDAKIQPDGKIVLGGYSSVGGRSYYSCARLNSNGSLDTTFNGAGITSQAGTFILPTFDGSTYDTAYGIALQADGSIVLGGYSTRGQNRYSAARLTSTGALDTTFNPTGAVQGTYILPTFTGSNQDLAGALQVQPDGKIVLAGKSNKGTVHFSFARLNTDGSLDTTFNSAQIGGTQQGTLIVQNFAGETILPFKGLALQPDSKILLVGSANAGRKTYAIVRLNSNGTLDTSFGPTGAGFFIIPAFNGSNQDTGSSIALTSTGTIVLGGYSRFAGPIYRYSLAELTNKTYTLNAYQDEYPGQGGFY